MTQVANPIIPQEILAGIAETASSLSIVAVVVFLGFILWGAFQGFRRSIYRQGIHLGVTFVIALVAFFMVSNFCSNIIPSFSEMTTAELIEMIQANLAAQGQEMEITAEELASIQNIDLETVGYVAALVLNTLVAPIVFTILFVLIGVIGKVVTGILGLFVPKGRTLVLKLLGVLGGVIEGAIIAGIVLLPVVGIVNIAGDAVDVVRDSEDESLVEIVEVYDDVVAPLENHVIVKTVGALGGDAILENFATVEVDGVERDLRKELPSILKLGLGVSYVQSIDMSDGLDDMEKAVISSVIDGVDDSLILSKIVCTGLNMYAEIYEQQMAEMPAEEMDPMTIMMGEMIGIFGPEKTNLSTLGMNLNTFKDVFFVIADSGLLETDDFVGVLASEYEEGVTVLNKLTSILEANDNTAHIVSMLTKMMVSTMLPEGSEEIPEEVVEEVKGSLSELVQIETEGREKEEVKADVEETVTELLGNFDITVGEGEDQLPQETLDELSEHITEELMNGNIDIPVDENGQISDADLLNFLVQYAGKLGYDQVPEVPETPDESQTEGE